MQFQPKSAKTAAAQANGGAHTPERTTHSRGVEGQAIVQLKAAVKDAFSPRNFLSAPTGAGEPLPPKLRAHHETESGVSLEDAQVFRNSPIPARWNAEALTFRNRVFLGPGKERHLAHEAWHVVQQKRNAVHADFRIGGTGVNTSARFENEADRMGARAEGRRGAEVMPAEAAPRSGMRSATPGVVQGYFTRRGQRLSEKDAKYVGDFVQQMGDQYLNETFFKLANDQETSYGDIDTWIAGIIPDLRRSTRRLAQRPGPAEESDSYMAALSDSSVSTAAAAAPSFASAMDVEHSPHHHSAAAASPAQHRARAIIWNMNHFGRPTQANAERLNQKEVMLRNLMQAGPAIVLLNEVNAGVDKLGQEFPKNGNYAFNAGPRMQAMGKQNQGTQIEYFPLIYDRRRYHLLRTLVATPDELSVASGDVFKWQKSENRSAAAAAAAAAYPEFRPLVVYCLQDSETKEEHWYGAVHTTPDGHEFRRTSIFQDQIRAAMAHISRAARKRGARLFIGGDYYLTPEAVVVSGAYDVHRNTANPPTTARFGLTQAVHDPDSSLEQKTPTNVAGIKAAMASTIAAPVFETNRKEEQGQIADLAVVDRWAHRALLPNLRDPAQAQNVDTPALSYSAPMYGVSDHLPVIFDLSASPNPLDVFRSRDAHPEAEQQLQRTINRALVLRTLTRAVGGNSDVLRPLPANAKYADVLYDLLTRLNAASHFNALRDIDHKSSLDDIGQALASAGFEEQWQAIASDRESADEAFSVHDFEHDPEYKSDETPVSGNRAVRRPITFRIVRQHPPDYVRKLFGGAIVDALNAAAPGMFFRDVKKRLWEYLGRRNSAYLMRRAD